MKQGLLLRWGKLIVPDVEHLRTKITHEAHAMLSTENPKTTARLYYEHPWRIYGTPETITSDRGPQFISTFMDELCRLTRVKQKLSTAYHPQTDGNTEILN